MSSSITPDTPVLNKERHVKYWLRCLKTFLPDAYTSNDASRMTLAFFILSALDLLGVLRLHTTISERAEFVDWIYHCQVPGGGFRGFTGTKFGDERRSSSNAPWDPANLAGTVFALSSLLVLGDDLGRVNREDCLQWLAKLQCDNGSFGECLGEGGVIEGGLDVRWCYIATLVRSMLRTEYTVARDIDPDGLTRFINASQTYEGGIARGPGLEAHAGVTYCGIGALYLLQRLPLVDSKPSAENARDNIFLQEAIRWLVSRQISRSTEEYHHYHITENDSPGDTQEYQSQEFRRDGTSTATTKPFVPPANPLDVPTEDLQFAGFNGGTLGILNEVELIDSKAGRRFLLDKTQHVVGGFGKLPGDSPDILHSYLGLTALAVMREPGLKSLNPTFCLSTSAKEHLENLPWKKNITTQE